MGQLIMVSQKMWLTLFLQEIEPFAQYGFQ